MKTQRALGLTACMLLAACGESGSSNGSSPDGGGASGGSGGSSGGGGSSGASLDGGADAAPDAAPCVETAVLTPHSDERVAQGSQYTARPELASGTVVRWSKAYGPDEVVVDASTGALTWSVPADLPSESFHIGLRGKDACGGVIEDVWVVTVGDGAVLRVGPGEQHLTIHSAFAAAASGDTIVISPGTYEGDGNSLDSNPSPAAIPPNGSAAALTTVIASEPGASVLTDGILWAGKWGELHHIALKGVYAKQGVSIQTGSDAAPRPHHIKLVDIASEGEIGVAHSDDVLVEGCYAFGNGRYKLSTYKSARVVFRRIVVRLDHAPLTGQETPFGACVAYSSDDVVFQNVIDIDSDQRAAYPDGEMTGAFSVPTTAGASNRIVYARSIVLNNALKLGSYDSTNGVADVRYDDIIAWDVDTVPGLPDLAHGFGKAVFDHGTFGAIRSDGDVAAITRAFFNGWGGQRDEVRNSAFSGIDGPLFYEFEALSYNAFHDTQSFAATGPEHDPDSFLFVDIRADSLRYLPRIEPGSALAGKAADGRDIGATVMTFRGRSGTFFGEPGWDDETGVRMWPFPHEERIADHMRSYAYSGNLQGGKAVQVSGARGFAARQTALDGGPRTLTSYIWEYLGAPCPADVCQR